MYSLGTPWEAAARRVAGCNRTRIRPYSPADIPSPRASVPWLNLSPPARLRVSPGARALQCRPLYPAGAAAVSAGSSAQGSTGSQVSERAVGSAPLARSLGWFGTHVAATELERERTRRRLDQLGSPGSPCIGSVLHDRLASGS